MDLSCLLLPMLTFFSLSYLPISSFLSSQLSVKQVLKFFIPQFCTSRCMYSNSKCKNKPCFDDRIFCDCRLWMP